MVTEVLPGADGPAKPRLAFFVEEPFTSETAELNVLRSGNSIDYGYLPAQEASQASVLASQGYTTSNATFQVADTPGTGG